VTAEREEAVDAPVRIAAWRLRRVAPNCAESCAEVRACAAANIAIT